MSRGLSTSRPTCADDREGLPSAAQASPARRTVEAGCLIDGIEWPAVDARVRAQQRNRETHMPPISLFRWWARRPHALIGAVLDAANQGEGAGPVVSDPFSGGGTVAIESARRGLHTYAQDLHPWAISGLKSALEEIDPTELERASDALLHGLEHERQRLYGTICPDHGGLTEIVTALWVRHVACPYCAADVYLYPYSYVSRASRRVEEKWGWWACRACGKVTRSSLTAHERRCSGCRRRLEDPKRKLVPSRRAHCVNAACRREFEPFQQAATWALSLVQRQCTIAGSQTVHLGRPSRAEIDQAGLSYSRLPPALAGSIPDGLETAVLRRAGLPTWSSLYVPRQIQALVAAAEGIDALPHGERIKDRLRLAICGAGEMAGRVSRWDRHYPKAYEVVANHRFDVTGLSAEVNPLASRGRGVLRRRLAASVRAARWRLQHLPPDLRLRRRAAATGPRSAPDGVLLAYGTSSRQLAQTASVDLVLTDPPYFDDVQYAELAALFLVWARAIGLMSDSVELDLSAEAVANTRRGTGVHRYRELLTAVLTETHRSLKSDGRMILTFHNTDLRAWWALGGALQDAQFAIWGLAVAWAENDTDHSKRGHLAFTRDLVLECRPLVNGAPSTFPPDASDEPQSWELLAAGKAIATMPPSESLSSFRLRYRRLRGPMSQPRISPMEKERDRNGPHA